MTAPIQNHSQVSQTQPSGPVQSRAPGGVGSAPTTMQGQPPAEKGYFDRLANAIKDFIVWLFSMIFSCCKKAETPPAEAQQQQTQGPDLKAQHQETLNRLKNTLRSEEFLRCFNSYYPSDAEKAPIYLRLGQAVPTTGWFAESPETIIQRGRGMVEREPSLIIPHLIQKLETLTRG